MGCDPKNKNKNNGSKIPFRSCTRQVHIVSIHVQDPILKILVASTLFISCLCIGHDRVMGTGDISKSREPHHWFGF